MQEVQVPYLHATLGARLLREPEPVETSYVLHLEVPAGALRVVAPSASMFLLSLRAGDYVLLDCDVLGMPWATGEGRVIRDTPFRLIHALKWSAPR